MGATCEQQNWPNQEKVPGRRGEQGSHPDKPPCTRRKFSTFPAQPDENKRADELSRFSLLSYVNIL